MQPPLNPNERMFLPLIPYFPPHPPLSIRTETMNPERISQVSR